jgi:hypothetical protein
MRRSVPLYVAWIITVLCSSVCALHAQPPPLDSTNEQPPAGLLIRIRARAIDNLDHQPNYTCTETIERSHRPKATGKFQMIDTIRLEVGLVDGKEMFGWPGSTKFEDTEMRSFVKAGAIGNGSFALHARAVFSGEASRFTYKGTGTADGRPWVRFVFSVPLARSGYSIQNGDQKAIVAYHGSFDADPNFFDLQRMEVIADELPPNLHLERASSTVEYIRTKIGPADFLLPTSSELSMVDIDGGENRNLIRFASCRQFAGESVLRFDDAPPSSPSVATELAEVVLPDRMGVTLALLEEIDLSKAAIGDPVRARLTNDLKEKGRLLIAKGAIATGRITRIERHSEANMLGITFDGLQGEGVRARLQLRLDDVMSADHVAAKFRYVMSPAQPGEGIIPMGTGRTKLNRGLLMNWSIQR